MEDILNQVLTCLSHVSPLYAAIAVVALYLFKGSGIKLPNIPWINPAPAPDAPAEPILDWLTDLIHKKFGDLQDAGHSEEDAVAHLLDLLRKPTPPKS